MKKNNGNIPVAVSINGLNQRSRQLRKAPVNKRVLYLSIQAVFNALIIGFVAKGLVYLIYLFTNLSFFGKFSFVHSSPTENHLGLFVVFVPIIGGLIVGLLARYGSKAISGHGIPEAMEKIIMDDSKIPPIITFLKPLSAAISIGTGGPFGAEGPIISTGGAFGSFTGQWMHISANERKIMLAAGSCAGMAAIFGSPLAAIFLAVELLLFEFSPRSIIPVAISCIAGGAMHIFLFGSDPVFEMPSIPHAPDSSLITYALLGLVMGVIAAFVSKSVYAIEDLFEKLPIHWMWWPAIGAIAIGVVGYFAPSTMGVGYDNIRDLLSGTLPLTMLFTLCFLKYISWAISLGSGTSGGTLAPLFTIGGALGLLLATLTLKYFPNSGINLSIAALIGMASMFVGASRALLTSIIFAVETTGQPNALMPLLCACVAAYFVSFFLMKGSIMTEKIIRRGVHAPDAYEPDLFQFVKAKDLLTASNNHPQDLPFIYETDSASFAAEMMGKYHIDSLVVLDNKENKNMMGLITSNSLLNYYSAQKQKENSYESPGKTKRILVNGRKIFLKPQPNED